MTDGGNGGDAGNCHVQWIGGAPVYLARPFDFTFLDDYGAVLSVVKNGGGSGNMCLCVEDGGKKYFVKYAGAPIAGIDAGAIAQAIEWLKNASRIYVDLAHENLITFVRGEAAGGGYLNVFEWVDAECVGYPDPPSRRRFLNLPAAAKMRAFGAILDFHAHVAERGYVAIDFYADQILYDFKNARTIVCDIDFYQKSPYYGDMGPWGSANFVSPEECAPGSRIDEITMVYTMGATAFSIFADYVRAPEAWTLGKALYGAAAKAVSDDRGRRQQSIREFMAEWAAAGAAEYI